MTTKLNLSSALSDREVVLRMASQFAKQHGMHFFFSGAGHEVGHRSFLCMYSYEALAVRGRSVSRESIDGKEMVADAEENPWDNFRQLIDCDRASGEFPEWVGYFGYEMGRFVDGGKELPGYSPNLPEALFHRCAVIFVADHTKKTAIAYVEDPHSCGFVGEDAAAVSGLLQESNWSKLANLPPVEPMFAKIFTECPLDTRSDYCEKVWKIQERIRSGEVYQVNLSHCALLCGAADPYQVFLSLSQVNPAPFSAYINTGEGIIVSSSPERLLLKEGGLLESRPIKGTICRGKSEKEDEYNRRQLLSSEKDRAELVMITDLMRNDLARVSKVGSVTVPRLVDCERYSNVYHLLSVVHSQAIDGLHPVDAVRACFPGGSVTGCPKIKAMEVIYEMERRPRGIYTGSVGYFCGNGDFDFNISIRTLTFLNEKIEVSLGGAVVIDSDPDAEYDETFDKGSSIFRVLGI